MKHVMILGLLFACGGDGDESDDTGTLSGVLTLGDDNNYAYEGTIDGPSFSVAEYTDATIDFSGLTSDLQCHGLDPVADIDNVSLLAFPYLSEEEVEAGLSNDDLQQSDMGAYVAVQPGDATSVLLSEFTFFGTYPEIIEDYWYEGSATWMMLFTTGTTVGVGGRALAFLEPTAGETNTDVVMEPACGILDFSADLTSLTPIPVPKTGPWTLNWSGLTVDGHGNAFDSSAIDSVMVGYYADLSEEDLAADFLDIESLADGLWTEEVPGGTAVALDDLVDGSGAAFTDFSAEGTWILALRCSLCANPAPKFLTLLDPR